MSWILAIYIVILLVLLVFIFSYFFLQRKMVNLLKAIPDETGTLVMQKTRINLLSLINLVSFIILAGLLCWGLINSASDAYGLYKNHALSNQVEDKIEFDDFLYTKPSRGILSSTPSIWVFFKYPQKGMESFGKLSEGPGKITGRILLNGKPLIQHTVSLILNDGAQGLDCLKTDAQGYYNSSIPFGKYEFNAMILSGDEVRGRISPQNSVSWQEPSGEGEAQVFELNEREQSYQLTTIELVDPVRHVTPNFSIVSLAKAAKGVKFIEWDSIVGALTYGVEVSRVVKGTHDNGEGKSYYPDEKSAAFRTAETFITLEQFKQLVTVYEPGVYGIRIFAYGNGNRILSYSLNFHEIALAAGEVGAAVSKK